MEAGTLEEAGRVWVITLVVEPVVSVRGHTVVMTVVRISSVTVEVTGPPGTRVAEWLQALSLQCVTVSSTVLYWVSVTITTPPPGLVEVCTRVKQFSCGFQPHPLLSWAKTAPMREIKVNLAYFAPTMLGLLDEKI